MKAEETEKFIREEVSAGEKHIRAAYEMGVSDTEIKYRNSIEKETINFDTVLTDAIVNCDGSIKPYDKIKEYLDSNFIVIRKVVQ